MLSVVTGGLEQPDAYTSSRALAAKLDVVTPRKGRPSQKFTTPLLPTRPGDGEQNQPEHDAVDDEHPERVTLEVAQQKGDA